MKLTLAAARVNAGMNQDEASKKAGISKPTLSKYEKHPQTIKMETLDKLAKIYGIPREMLNV